MKTKQEIYTEASKAYLKLDDGFEMLKKLAKNFDVIINKNIEENIEKALQIASLFMEASKPF